MDIIDSIKELFDSVHVAMSPKTLQAQWKDMVGMLSPARAQKQPSVSKQSPTVLKLRLCCGKWPHGQGTVITARKQNFTFGNADIFDVCLDPGNEQVGDVWCSVFFDEALGGYVLMQATGSFNVRVTDEDEPYRPGDWSLYPNGLSFQTFPQTNVLVPLSDEYNPQRVFFSIGNAYFFEAWAYAETEAAQPESVQPEETAVAVTVQQQEDPVATKEEKPAAQEEEEEE